MNDCKPIQQYLEIFALEEAACNETKLVQDHLARCQTCRNQVRELREAWSMLPAGLTPAAPSESMEAHLMARIEAHPLQPGRGRWEQQTEHLLVRYHWLKFPVAAAVMIASASLLYVGGVWPNGAPRAEQTPMAAQLESIAEALEKIDLIKRNFGAPKLQYVSLYEVRPAARIAAFLVYDWAAQEGHFLARNLMPLHGESVYQLWLLDREGGVLASASFLPNGKRLGTTLIALPGSLNLINQVILTREASPNAKQPSAILELQSRVGVEVGLRGPSPQGSGRQALPDP